VSTVGVHTGAELASTQAWSGSPHRRLVGVHTGVEWESTQAPTGRPHRRRVGVPSICQRAARHETIRQSAAVIHTGVVCGRCTRTVGGPSPADAPPPSPPSLSPVVAPSHPYPTPPGPVSCPLSGVMPGLGSGDDMGRRLTRHTTCLSLVRSSYRGGSFGRRVYSGSLKLAVAVRIEMPGW